MPETPTIELPVQRANGTPRPASPGGASLPLNSYRPRRPTTRPGSRQRFALGRRLRAVAGVDEELLDWVPEERARYTRLGAIILNTGLLAGLSLATALTTFLHVSLWIVLPVALVWAYVIVSFDGWLIASTHGVLSRSKWRMFLPRLVISLLMGAAIAEPLVLWVFDAAIHKNVLDVRQAEIDAYAGALKECNPSSGEQPADPRCLPLRLPVEGSPDALRDQLKAVTAERDRQAGQIATINEDLDEKKATARDECGGASGRGLTGRYGEGVNCRTNRADAEQYRTDSKLAERQGQLDALNTQIDGINARLAAGQAGYAENLTRAINEKVAEKKAAQGDVGILDQGAALERLSATSSFIFAAGWLLRFLLIALDCMPVLTKAIGGTTAYDELVSRQLAAGKRLHERDLNLHERRDTAASDVYLRNTELNRKIRLERIAEAGRAASANREADLEAEIDKLAARLRGRG